MSTLLTFEHPLNERTRTFLRLEHLFDRFDFFAPQYDSWATRVAVECLIDIVAITARADVRNELLKELERNLAGLQRFASQPGVDEDSLARVMDDLQAAIDRLRELSGPLGQSAREDEFLKSVAQRNSIPGGTCCFDLPRFHHWLIQSPDIRRERMENWLGDLRPVDTGIRLALSLIRRSAAPRQVLAEGGFFQESLDAQSPAQMVRVGLQDTGTVYPEISGHKNRFSIRFMHIEPRGRATQSVGDIPFRLTCCVF